VCVRVCVCAYIVFMCGCPFGFWRQTRQPRCLVYEQSTDMCVWACACVCACLCVCLSVYLSVLLANQSICVSICLHVCMCVYMYVCMCVCIYVCELLFICVYVCMYCTSISKNRISHVTHSFESAVVFSQKKIRHKKCASHL